MLKFKFLLWAFAQLLKRQIKHNPDCARYVDGKSLVFQIHTASGMGRYYVSKNPCWFAPRPGVARGSHIARRFSGYIGIPTLGRTQVWVREE
jgi:hypothetical protein